MQKVKLEKADKTELTINVSEGCICEWAFDEALRPFVEEPREPWTLRLHFRDDIEDPPAFGLVTATVRDAGSRLVMAREDFIVNLARQSTEYQSAIPFFTPKAAAKSTGSVGDILPSESNLAETPDITLPAALSKTLEASGHALAVPGGELSGDYMTILFRENVEIANSSILIPRNKSLLVGRDPKCDLPLHDHFYDEASGKKCSGTQAEIFWAGRRIVIRTLGKNCLQLINTDGVLTPLCKEAHYWQPEERLMVPGGIELRIRKTQE